MLKDKMLKVICIPVLGLFIPVLSHLLILSNFSFVINLLSILLFIATSSFIWQGAVSILATLRNGQIKQRIFLKLFVIICATAFYSGVIAFASSLLWQRFFLEHLYWQPIIKTVAVCMLSVIFFTLIYEILFLNKEREIDTKVVKYLEQELEDAEINILKNELDPHFVYNTLMPLYYLIKNDVQKAEMFTYKLMQVYQYFLDKRKNDFITLEEELKFIENYFYLLQIRFKDSVSLTVQVTNEARKMLVLPFSLQILIENAIKHNELNNEDPLQIIVQSERNFVEVSNKLQNKFEETTSSKIGLNNLRTRHKLLCNYNISVFKSKELFCVKIPLLRNTKAYDVNSYSRG